VSSTTPKRNKVVGKKKNRGWPFFHGTGALVWGEPPSGKGTRGSVSILLDRGLLDRKGEVDRGRKGPRCRPSS